jgi:hypothetical protein
MTPPRCDRDECKQAPPASNICTRCWGQKQWWLGYGAGSKLVQCPFCTGIKATVAIPEKCKEALGREEE